MIKQEMKIGPKGQVVIPKLFREEKNIFPGDKVIIELGAEGIIIEKPVGNPVKILRDIAKKGKSVRADSDKDYDEMMKARWKKLGI